MVKPAVISLFSGVGGLDVGLSMAGFDVRLQIDMDHSCCESLRKNRQRYWPRSRIIEGRLEDWETPRLLEAAGLEQGQAFLVSGGPPCQPFSKSAFWSPNRWTDKRRRRPSAKKSRSAETFRVADDPRARLVLEFTRVVREASPVMYLLENVHGLAYKTARTVLDPLHASLEAAGYSFSSKVLNAANYGVPQKRDRLFIVGTIGKRPGSFPEPSHCEKPASGKHSNGLPPHVTAQEAIGDLDDGKLSPDEVVGGKWGHLLPLVPPGSNYLFFTKRMGYPKPIFKWRSRYWSFLLKLAPDKPSWTIQAQPGPYVGPFHWKNRRLRISEIKRLQTFPDDYQIHGNRPTAQRQIGDAVPCLLARRIGEALRFQTNDVA